MPISGIVFVGWVFISFVSLSALVFWLLWPVVEQRVSTCVGGWMSDVCMASHSSGRLFPKFEPGVLAMHMFSDMARHPLGHRIVVCFQWCRWLLPDFQGVGVVSGVQEDGLASGVQHPGLASGGVEGFHQRYGPGQGDMERKAT